jgi:hydrophobic/amphiphilic exporter-1 (mainly G- bacteria), HAE1 family
MTKLSIERPLTVLMGILALVLLGGVSYTYLKVDRLPPITFPVITVTTAYPSAAAQDVEQLLTEPIEDALAGLSGVETISSTSSEGRSQVRVQLYAGSDPNMAALDVERRIARIRSRLPNDASDPVVNKADPNESPVMNIALAGAPLDQLFDIADRQVQPQFQSVLGVSSVSISGGLQREVQVRIDQSKLAAYNVSATQVNNSITGGNVATTVGTSQQGPALLNIRVVGNFQGPEELQYLVVAQLPAGPVYLKDVATVDDGYKEVRQVQRLNGQPAVGLSVVKASDANAIEVADGVRNQIKKLEPLLPEGAAFHVTNDSSVYTRRSLEAVQTDLGLAVLFVGLITLIFLHQWRNVLIILLSIPTCVFATFLAMYALGFTLNLMTLMAIALMIGILVDASIVVIENVHRHHQLGASPWEAALKGRNEIGMATLAIAGADIVVYVPIAFMPGFEGQLFRQYGLTVVIATIFSVLVSFTLTPMLASRWLRHEEESNSLWARLGRAWDRGFDRFAALLEHVVPVAIKARWLVVLVSIGMVGASLMLIQNRMVGLEYAPAEDDNNFSVNITAPPGTSLEGIERAARQVEAALEKIPEIKNVFTSITVPGGSTFGGSGTRANLAVELVAKHDRTRSVTEVLADVRRLGREVPGVRIIPSVSSPLPGGGGSGNLNVNVNGPELDTLNQLVDDVMDVAGRVPGLTDVRANNDAGTPELHIDLDGVKMSQLNVTAQQVTDALRTTLGGRVVSVLRPTGKLQQDITVIARDTTRADLANLGSIPIRGGASLNSATGNTAQAVVTLAQVGAISYGTGPVEIQRTNRNRTFSIDATAVGRPLGDVAADLQAAISSMQVPAGYSVTPGRSVDRFNTAIAALGAALAMSLLLEYMLLVALYESFFYPLVLMLSVPLGLVGSIVGLWITGNTINMFSIIGLIMAFGLVAKNGILLVDFANTLRARGVERTQALAEATRARLRPILMTSATMVGGMFPLAMKLEAGAESRAPMAVVVIGAILTSTVLAVLVIPAVYTLFDDLQNLLFRRRVAVAVPATAEPVHASPAIPAMPAGGAVMATNNGNGHVAVANGRPVVRNGFGSYARTAIQRRPRPRRQAGTTASASSAQIQESL